MQEKEAQPRQTAYSYSQLAFTEVALAPGQNSIGTGGQNSIGADKLAQPETDDVSHSSMEPQSQRSKRTP